MMFGRRKDAIATALTDNAAWTRAQWGGMAYHLTGPAPSMLVLFKQTADARHIFQQLQTATGRKDLWGLLRVTILEDATGYTVELRASGRDDRPARQRRMDGDTASPSLQDFRRSLKTFPRRYWLTPATFKGAPNKIEAHHDLAIGLSRIEFASAESQPRSA